MTLDADESGDVYDRALMGALLVTINIAVGVIGLLGLLSTLPCFGSVMERILAKKKRPEKEQVEQGEIAVKPAAKNLPSRHDIANWGEK